MKILPNVFLFLAFSSTWICTSQDISFPDPVVEYCRTSTDEIGRCVSFRECTTAVQEIRKGIKLSHCGFQGKVPIVCCPGDPVPAGNASDKIVERTTQNEVAAPTVNFTCGKRGFVAVIEEVIEKDPNALSLVRRRRSSIVSGGKTSLKNSWPWMALLGRKKENSTMFFCSAVVINNNFLITAAHCVLSLEPFFVRLAEHDYGPEFGENLFHSEEDVEIDRVRFHPKFEFEQAYHDVALIKLAKPVNFRSEVSPICLPWGRFSSEDLINKTVTVAGWGRLSYGGDQSSVLQEVNVMVFDPLRCKENYSTLRHYRTSFPEGMTWENIVCAGDVEGIKDACKGDSGGPMMYYNSEDNTYSLAAIVAKGYGCGLKEFPGLYTPIRNHETLQWIKNIAFS